MFECIIPANNNFGYENVIDKIKPILSKYLETIIEDEERVFNLLSLFWFYLQDETLNFVYKIIENFPENSCVVYNGNYSANDFAFTQNRIIELLGQFFRCQCRLKDSIEHRPNLNFATSSLNYPRACEMPIKCYKISCKPNVI